MSDELRLLNDILAGLPLEDWESMRPEFQRVSLVHNSTLWEAGETLRCVHFPITGVISAVAHFEDGATAERATVGREGMLEVEAIVGSTTSLSRAIVQVRGVADTVPYETFRRWTQEIPAFQQALNTFAQAYLAQVLQSVACNAVHSVHARAARWLLTCDDRNEGKPFALTQEFLAMMLGVSRPVVSTIARSFQRAGFIRYVRGQLTVTNRQGLEGESCPCYGLICDAYEQRSIRIR